MPYTRKQKRRAWHIYRVGRKKGRSRKELLAALETALVEANLGNPRGGDRDSVGWRQERSHYGSVANRMNVRAAASRFFDETAKANPNKYKTAGQLAQAVQRSAHPGRYDARAKQAKDLLHHLEKVEKKKGGIAPAGGRGDGLVTTQTVKKVIPGVDNEPLRQQAKLSYVQNRNNPNALLELAQGLKQAQDIPGQVVTKTKREVVPGEMGARGGGGALPPAKSPDARNSLARMQRIAEAVDRKKLPYLWGGGHGARPAKVGEPVDCSGFVSQVLGINPMVSGALAKWGKPGRGKHVTVYANSKHVLIKIGKRWYGTSRQNPKGGAGRIKPPTRAYLANFAARHPRGL